MLVKRKKVGQHFVYAYYDTFGRIRFMDRSVGLQTFEAYASLKNVAAAYHRVGIDDMVPIVAVPVFNLFVKSVGTDIPKLVMAVPAIVAEYKDGKR